MSLWQLFKATGKRQAVIVTLMVLTSSAQVAASLYAADALQNIVQQNWPAFLWATVMQVILFLVYLFLMYFQINSIGRTRQVMLTLLRGQLTTRMAALNYQSFHGKDVASYVSWLSNDMQTIDTLGLSTFYNVLFGCISAVIAFFTLLHYHWSIVLLAFVMGALLMVLPKAADKMMAQKTLAVTKENEAFIETITDLLKGFDTLFAFNLVGRLISGTKTASLKLNQANNAQVKVIGLVAVIGGVGNVLGQISVAGLAGYLIFRGIFNVGSLMAIGNLASTIFNTLGNLTQQLAQVRSTKAVFEKFNTLSSLPTENNAPAADEKLTAGFDLHDLSYAYDQQTPVFTGLTYHFALGKKYILQGASGSGKSTLLNILTGKLTDYTGQLTLNHAELQTLAGPTLRQHVLYVDQAPYLFNTTIAENILLAENFSDAEVAQALAQSALTEVIADLPLGLQTPVGEGGRLLSGGQRQRVALARGLLRNKDIILLDEGTSALDEKNARSIENQLLATEKTVIFITHHLHPETAAQVDGILALASE